jgi:hypothetical protein
VTNDDTHYAKGPQQSSAPHGYAATTVPSTPYRWRDGPPTEPGFYWCRFRAPQDHREGSHIVQVIHQSLYDNGDVELKILIAIRGSEVLGPVALGPLGYGVLKDARWAGPIPEPLG